MKPLNYFQYWNSRFKVKSSVVLFYVMLSIIIASITSVISLSIYYLIISATLMTALFFISIIIMSILIVYWAWPIFFKDYFLYRKNFKN